MISINRVAGFVMIAMLGSTPAAMSDECATTAQLQREAADLELQEGLEVDLATCINLGDPWAFVDCLFHAFDEYLEGRELADAQYDARLELCELLGGGIYDPQIDPANFVDEIDNPYLPFPVGARWIYESRTDEGLETIEVTVLEETREILGVECVSVRDVVSLEGEVIEDTIDWYAQDTEGNVWYFGEISFTYEDGYVANIDGSWLAGVEGAKPGIVMLGDPVAGVTYRQEWLLGLAEDAATVLATDAGVKIGLGRFKPCVKTADFLPPEPDALEHKFYAPGIGFIFETKVGSDETVELIEYSKL